MTQKKTDELRRQELDAVTSLGFSWKVPKGGDALEFLRLHFPGFSPLTVSQQAESLLAPMAGTPVTRQWKLAGPPPELSLYFCSADWFNEKTGIALCRTFRRTEKGLEVHHDYFAIPGPFRNQGTGKQALKTWFAQYERMKVQRIIVYATLTNGGYVWARAGFKAVKRDEVDRILAAGAKQLPPNRLAQAKLYYDDHYNNFPDQPFPMEEWTGLLFMREVLQGSSWHGEIDLTNETEFRTFKAYVNN